jgi:hypothetical protein
LSLLPKMGCHEIEPCLMPDGSISKKRSSGKSMIFLSSK